MKIAIRNEELFAGTVLTNDIFFGWNSSNRNVDGMISAAKIPKTDKHLDFDLQTDDKQSESTGLKDKHMQRE